MAEKKTKTVYVLEVNIDGLTEKNRTSHVEHCLTSVQKGFKEANREVAVIALSVRKQPTQLYPITQ